MLPEKKKSKLCHLQEVTRLNNNLNLNKWLDHHHLDKDHQLQAHFNNSNNNNHPQWEET